MPEVPDVPEIPDEPEDPDASEVPDVPEASDESEVPDEPEVTDVPEILQKTPEQIYAESFIFLVKDEEIHKNMVGISDTCGSRYYTGKGIKNAYDYLISALKGYGYTSKQIVTDNFTANDVAVKNIYCTIPTTVKNPDIVVFCAHYDSAQSGKGAVDNASGVCTVLELARLMKSMNKDFGKEIRFCFFAGEEIGYYGAYRYCWYISQSTSTSPASIKRHKFVMNIDMAAHSTEKKNWYLCVSAEPVTAAYPIRTAKKNYTSDSIDSAKAIVGSCGEYKYLSPVAAGKTDLLPFRKNGLTGVTLSWREIDSSRSEGG